MNISESRDASFSPIVHCITNVVTINDCANVLHAIGVAPVMAHHPKEVAQVSSMADALVLNLGATESFDAMKNAIKAASDAKIPIVIDPVGVGGIDHRREMFYELLKIAVPTCVRGNISEIKALLYHQNTTAGVDAHNGVDMAEADEADTAIVECLAKRLGCIVVASGVTDIISNGNEQLLVEAGTPMLTRITGAGCMSSAIIGGYLARLSKASNRAMNDKAIIEAVYDGCRCMAECGEAAARKTSEAHGGIMTFHMHLLDLISTY